jgi:ATP-dependent RNA helicase DeaD
MTKVNQASHQEIERKKVLVLKGNQTLGTSHQEIGEKKSFGFKRESSFAKKNKSKPNGFTNNPKYFERKPSENTSSDSEKKSFSFKGKKKFKSRIADLKTLALKNIVKKELDPKIF